MVVRAWGMVRKLDLTSERSPWVGGGGEGGLPSPTSPLDRSPRGWRHRHGGGGGVGLGILAALEKPDPSPPIAIASPRRAAGRGRLEVSELGCSGRCATALCGGGGASAAEFRVADFLSCCHLCRRRLDGKDIYMYRGEKAFCSMECRYKQILSDEYQEKENCGGAAEIVGSPYSGGQIFFTGIVAA